jgi:hypothetical protein
VLSPSGEQSRIEWLLSGLAAHMGLAVLAAVGLGIMGIAAVLWAIPGVEDPFRVLVAGTGFLLLVLAELGIYVNPGHR